MVHRMVGSVALVLAVGIQARVPVRRLVDSAAVVLVVVVLVVVTAAVRAK